MTPFPDLSQFRIEAARDDIVHLVFDCPGRTMNVFSEAAIADLGIFSDWLGEADVRGVVIRSGKANAFCAGADLNELGAAYDMIVAASPRLRFERAFDHFFPLSRALRRLETSGKPVVAAIAGLALGGGCELALAAHHRVLVDDPRIGLGLPESLVGLLPGAGGTQRLPRLIGIAAALPILLAGARLASDAARSAGLVDTLVTAGDEVAAAEEWILSVGQPLQPWDREGWEAASASVVEEALRATREQVLAETLGHYPAPLAILDCIAVGLPQSFDGAIRSEMAIFAHLIQREEPRNMIATMFLAKTDYERLRRMDALPAELGELVSAARAAIGAEDPATLAPAGFGGSSPPVRTASSAGYWIDGPAGRDARQAVARIDAAVVGAGDVPASMEPLADYAIVSATGYPAYLGGPFARRAAAGRCAR